MSLKPLRNMTFSQEGAHRPRHKGGLLALYAILLLSACEAPSLGVEYRGERLDVVDMHLHTGEWDHIPPGTQHFLAERFPHPIGLNAATVAEAQISPQGILEQMDRGGVERAVLLAVYAPRTVGVTTNEQVIENLAAAPERLMGLASLRVDRWDLEADEQLAALDAALSVPGMVGVKLAHAHMHFRFDDPAYWGIYSVAAAHDAPVYLHTGSTPFPGAADEPAYTDPAYLEAAIQAHPDTRFIIGHLGYDFLAKRPGHLEECLRLASTYSNVWLEPSALGSKGADPSGENLTHAMRRIREEGLTSRVIYGSDGPQAPGFVADYLERTLVAMEAGGWTTAEAQSALRGNFDQLFGAALEP
ncbi:MAG: amidohydrolase family protein [Myxococcota bacterium]|nr:amidohydrolase family protein [Myxococcota bacterium]